jgi:protoporphyrinogen oxidase
MKSINTKPIVISGSGLSALMVARMVRNCINDKTPILIVEQESKIGGQFGSFDYGEYGLFDYGMHIYYESCVPEIDALFEDIFPKSDWNILEGNRKDIAGLFVNGRLQVDTPYIDLRETKKEFHKKCIGDLFLHIERIVGKNESNTKGGQRSAYEVSCKQFGKFITNRVLVPVFEKLYQTHPSHLDEIAVHLTTVNRIALFNPRMSLELMRSDAMRARICYPDQLNLPPLRSNAQRGFYPKTYGMVHVLNRFKQILEKLNTKFLTSSKIASLDFEDKKICSVQIDSAEHGQIDVEIDRLYWTAGLPPLAKLMEIDMGDRQTDRSNKDIYYVNFLFEAKPEMGELYYFYCFEPGFRTFRVTNYANYCPQAVRNSGCPLCVEMWMQSGDPTDLNLIVDMARNELIRFGVVADTNHLIFARAEKVSAGGFPLPSLNNIRYLETARDRIEAQKISNLKIFGVYSAKNTFFIKDILIDAYEKILQ